MACVAERLEASVGAGVGALGVAEVDEDTVGAVALGLKQGLIGHGQDAATVLAGALGDQLLDPEAETGHRIAHDEGELVAAVAGELPDRQTEPETRVDLRESKCAQACSASTARSSRACNGAPISAAGTRPNSDSAE